ncbi:hypothetical protein [Blastococcus sp. SYSU D00695]
MTLRAADLRFLLPHPVETALVVGDGRLPGMSALAAGLREAGVQVHHRAPRAPLDLVVAPGGDGAAGLRTPARTHVLLGRGGIRAADGRRPGRPYLLRGTAAAPRLLLPLRPAGPLDYHLRTMATPASRLTRARLRGGAALVGHLPRPWPLIPSGALVTVVSDGAPADSAPAVLQAVAHLGVATDGRWLLALGTGDELQRAVFLVLDGPDPAWAVKFSRVPGHRASFLRDEAGLALARAAGGPVAAHAPAHLGRVEVGGLTASVETAAVGRQLVHLLPRQPLRLLDAVADWTVQLGRSTARPPAALEPERARLSRLLADSDLDPGLLDRLPPLPAVLQHNDLGSWNIVSDGERFTVLDWESAREAGLPLWDLLYFAADVLARLDGPADAPTLLRRALAVLAGESPHSPRLFRWLHAAAEAAGVPDAALGPLATLCWAHHGTSAARRQADLRGAAPAPLGHLALLAPAWLAHPALGVDWPASRR